jgi:hypothetical protein
LASVFGLGEFAASLSIEEGSTPFDLLARQPPAEHAMSVAYWTDSKELSSEGNSPRDAQGLKVDAAAADTESV